MWTILYFCDLHGPPRYSRPQVKKLYASKSLVREFQTQIDVKALKGVSKEFFIFWSFTEDFS